MATMLVIHSLPQDFGPAGAAQGSAQRFVLEMIGSARVEWFIYRRA